MTHIQLDDAFFDHPKVLSISKDAKIIAVAAICYAGRQLTDGFVPFGAVTVLAAKTGVTKIRVAIDELVEARMWESVDGGYRIHDYLDYNSSAERVREKQAAARERARRNRSQEVRANFAETSHEVREPTTTTTTTSTSSSIDSEVKPPLVPPKRSGRKQDRHDLTGFDEWYGRYPRKMKRPAAEAAWAKLNAEERQAAINALIDQVHWPSMQGDEQYIPYPASWLNGRRWLDERPRGLSPPLPIGWTQGRMDEYVRRRRERMSIPEDVIPIVDAYIAALEGRQAA